MRDCRMLLEKLETNHKRQFDFIKRKIAEKDKEGYRYFLGIRDDYLGLYYKGHRMAKIEVSVSNVTYDTAEYYVPEKNVNHKKMDFEEFCRNFEDIRKRIDKHTSGVHDGVKRLERVCQQWIMNMNNADPLSEWYFLDMEYTQVRKDGQIDMIAVRRKADDSGKHAVALIELKAGKGSYGRESGLIDHMKKIMGFLENPDKYNRIREELSCMISSYQKLGLIDAQNGLGGAVSAEKFAKKPDVYFLNYTYVPGYKEQKNESLLSMKKSFFYYLYSDWQKELSEEQVGGILKVKEKFRGIVDDFDANIIACRQQIGKEDYRFIFQFIDPDTTLPRWKCLESD